MEKVIVFEYNGITRITLQECSLEAFNEAVNIYKTLTGKIIIKPSVRAFEQYLENEKPLEKLKNESIDKFEILGVNFNKRFSKNEVFTNKPLINFIGHEGNRLSMIAIPKHTKLLKEVFNTYTGLWLSL